MCNIFADICAAFEIIFEFVAGGAIIIKDNIYLFRINRNWSSSD